MVSDKDRLGDDMELSRYLLGALSPEETERLDELSISDDAFADRLRAAEYELVDAYAAGTLPLDMASRFGEYYLSSPIGLQKVLFAETLRAYRPAAAAPGRGRARLRASISRPMAWLAAAAVLVVTMLAGYLLVDDLRLRQAVRDSHAADAARAETERRMKARPDVPGAAAAPSPSTPAGPLLSLVIAAPTRGSDAVPTFAVPSNARVSLKLVLDVDEYPQYAVVLTDPIAGATVARVGAVRAESLDGSRVVPVDVGLGVLKPQRYLAELSGLRAGRPPELLAAYAFRVEAK